jgi:arylsulfatase A-like enzyme
LAAPDIFDLRQESKRTLDLYGLGADDTTSFAWQCLVARRMVERGVRFVEVIDGDSGVDRNWDAHAELDKYELLARNVDQPIAALIRDLRWRGMLEDTLVVFTTEFGRGPFVPSPGTNGREHHARVYASWLCGAGVRGGLVFGSSDELGDRVEENEVSVHDLQATILHLLGMDHKRLTYRHAGRDFRLTDVHGQIVREVLS